MKNPPDGGFLKSVGGLCKMMFYFMLLMTSFLIAAKLSKIGWLASFSSLAIPLKLSTVVTLDCLMNSLKCSMFAMNLFTSP